MGVIVVQARMGSSRLPGKVLADLRGRPLLSRLIRRLSGSALMPRVLVATTDLPEDDAVADVADAEGAIVFRGHPTDVLQRFIDALAVHHLERVARVSADSPFLDAVTVDVVADVYERAGVDIVQNHRRMGWPIGTAVEVLDRSCVERLGVLVSDIGLREHVTLYAYEHPEAFTTVWVPPPASLKAPTLNLLVDNAADLERARRIQTQIHDKSDEGEATLAEILATVGRRQA